MVLMLSSSRFGSMDTLKAQQRVLRNSFRRYGPAPFSNQAPGVKYLDDWFTCGRKNLPF